MLLSKPPTVRIAPVSRPHRSPAPLADVFSIRERALLSSSAPYVDEAPRQPTLPDICP